MNIKSWFKKLFYRKVIFIPVKGGYIYKHRGMYYDRQFYSWGIKANADYPFHTLEEAQYDVTKNMKNPVVAYYDKQGNKVE